MFLHFSWPGLIIFLNCAGLWVGKGDQMAAKIETIVAVRSALSTQVRLGLVNTRCKTIGVTKQ